ncbi:hypothetical protein L596_001760 [Steinernema carpocapsae]|uniref:WW domain-containing protein n=1 Tax=Steinernema carpocapsae TaxID=34508 RepID=A0A4U8UMF7_STECR|nr:hypothetical protein L596_001760 [Steinernema carpocapsae]
MPIIQSGTFFNNGTEARPRGPPPRGPVPLRGLNPMPMGQTSHFGSYSSGTAVNRVGAYSNDQQMPAFRAFMQMSMSQPPMDPSAQMFPAMLRKVANLKEGEDLWVSAMSPEGKEYYYKTITRETVWEKPKNAVIVDQRRLTELIDKANEEVRKDMAD